MQVTAKLSNLRVSPRKVRLVADLIRGMDAVKAKSQLSFLSKKPALPVLKLLNSAIANAKHNYKLDPNDLYISKITVDGGPVLKRVMPRAMGRAFIIRKRSSHVNLTLSEKKDKNQFVLAKKNLAGSKKKVMKRNNNNKRDDGKEKNQTIGRKSHSAPKKEKPKRLTGLAKRAFK